MSTRTMLHKYMQVIGIKCKLVTPLVTKHFVNFFIEGIDASHNLGVIFLQFIPHGPAEQSHGVLVGMKAVYGLDELPYLSSDVDPIPCHIE